ncbi:MAG: hypothetical protein F6K58_31620 [Symploca sp. SIO2E9]|nr:hypothetical protein [Symploca sp. SIO2E9]
MSISWSDFFQFETGERFKINGPDNFKGQGKVTEQTDKKLTLVFDIEEQTIDIKFTVFKTELKIPKLNATVTITLFNEGAGNRLQAQATYTNQDGKEEKIEITDKNIMAKVRRKRTLKLFASPSTYNRFPEVPDGALNLLFKKERGSDENDFDVAEFGIFAGVDFDLILDK